MGLIGLLKSKSVQVIVSFPWIKSTYEELSDFHLLSFNFQEAYFHVLPNSSFPVLLKGLEQCIAQHQSLVGDE